MKQARNVLAMFRQNVTRVVLLLCAISLFCGCGAKERGVKTGETAPVFSSIDIAANLSA